MKSILFVCTGNICRSPTADSLLRHKIRAGGLCISSDSCGIHGYHAGESPDPRTVAVAKERGIDMSELRARKILQQDFNDFDLLIAMDKGHQQFLMQESPDESRCKVKLFCDYVDGMQGDDIPDPYYGELDGFVRCFDLIESGVNSILNSLSQNS